MGASLGEWICTSELDFKEVSLNKFLSEFDGPSKSEFIDLLGMGEVTIAKSIQNFCSPNLLNTCFEGFGANDS